MSSLLFRQREQRDVFALEPLGFLGGHDDGGATVNRIDHGDGLEVPIGHQLADRAVVDVHVICERDGSEAAVIGTAHQSPDFLDVDEDGHVAALASELPFAMELAIEDEPDDFLAGAAALLGCIGNVGLALAGRFDGFGVLQQPLEEAIEVFGRELDGGPVVGGADPWNDQTGPVQHVPLHAWGVEVFAGLPDREGAGRGFSRGQGATLGIEQAVISKIQPMLQVVMLALLGTLSAYISQNLGARAFNRVTSGFDVACSRLFGTARRHSFGLLPQVRLPHYLFQLQRAPISCMSISTLCL
jgi:hypothetical protein